MSASRSLSIRPRRGDDVQVAVLFERARREPVADRVILPGWRSGEDRSLQERVVAGKLVGQQFAEKAEEMYERPLDPAA